MLVSYIFLLFIWWFDCIVYLNVTIIVIYMLISYVTFRTIAWYIYNTLIIIVWIDIISASNVISVSIVSSTVWHTTMRIDFIIALIIMIHCVSNRSLITSKYAAAEDIIVHCITPLVSISDDTYIRYYMLIVIFISVSIIHQPYILMS